MGLAIGDHLIALRHYLYVPVAVDKVMKHHDENWQASVALIPPDESKTKARIIHKTVNKKKRGEASKSAAHPALRS